jgi:hypothetical protein
VVKIAKISDHNIDPPGPHAYPESLVRVQKLTGKSLTFYEADLVDKDALRQVFSKVRRIRGRF